MTSLILLKDWLNTNLEIWKPIPGIDGYDVSSLGTVASRRAVGSNQYTRKDDLVTRRILKPSPDEHGYHFYYFRVDGGRKIRRSGHRLVALAFIPPVPDKDTVNHKNNISSDNRAENLEWVTQAENVRHAADIRVTPSGERHHRAKLTEAQVLEMRRMWNDGGWTYDSLGQHFNIQSAWDVITRHSWKHI